MYREKINLIERILCKKPSFCPALHRGICRKQYKFNPLMAGKYL